MILHHEMREVNRIYRNFEIKYSAVKNAYPKDMRL